MRSPDVAVVGGGAVGLYLALALLREGLHPRVFERGVPTATGSSRSIGVHPPSIELFAELGLAEALLSRAVRVERGLAFGARGKVGEVSFDRCPPPHRFVATLEQWKTEAVLRDALVRQAPDALVTGADVVHVRNEPTRATLTIATPDGRIEELAFRAIVGADGKRSSVRRAISCGFDGGYYEGEYAMADATDTTPFGHAAAIFLTPDGLVESFPLPSGRRRWVVRRGRDHGSCHRPTRHHLSAVIAERTSHTIDPSLWGEPSSFRAERRLASALAVGRIALVGDAAHVVSPIGGQGMNLGWLGARSVASVLGAALRAGADPSDALARDALHRRARARVATRRAEMNMWLGRPTRHSTLRELVVGTLLALPTSHVLARAFTMRWLDVGL